MVKREKGGGTYDVLFFRACVPPTAPPMTAAMRSTIKSSMSRRTFKLTPQYRLGSLFTSSSVPFSTTAPSSFRLVPVPVLVTVFDNVGSNDASPIACGGVVSITWGASLHRPCLRSTGGPAVSDICCDESSTTTGSKSLFSRF